MIYRTIAFCEPMSCAEKVKDQPGFAFLDSAGPDLDRGRYAFIGFDPFGEFVIRDGHAYWNDARLDGPPLKCLQNKLAQYALRATHHDRPLPGGCIGHIAYEFGQSLETLDPPQKAIPSCCDMRFGFYDLIIGFDRQNRQAWIVSTGFPACDETTRNTRAQGRIETALGYLARPAPARQNAQPVTGWASNFTRDGFVSAVHKTRDYIAQGDIYQANLTQRFTAPLPPHFDPWAFYRNLRTTNPAPFSAYLQDGDTVFASSSPERFIQLQNGTLEARPIKGTTARGPTNAEDQARAKALVASEKDRAENVVIVDLLRNDMSRVCQPGSVHVPTLCGLESYASVHHLTSVVQGQIQTGLGPVDVIKACFPGGSITGAPKIRAMDIITELEQVARGVYCGAIGYIGFDGNMDLNIAIRTAIIGAGHAVVQAGGGITLLSDPQAEYDETLTKADRLFAAFAASS